MDLIQGSDLAQVKSPPKSGSKSTSLCLLNLKLVLLESKCGEEIPLERNALKPFQWLSEGGATGHWEEKN